MSTPTFDALRTFFENSEAAKKATKPLHEDAQVALLLDGGPAHFIVKGGKGVVLEGPAPSPDFSLALPDAAAKRITDLKSDDVGEFGIEFFKLVLESDPALKVRIKIEASTGQLLSHGYLSVLAQGGLKVTWWLLKNGVKNPKAAIDRLRGK
ncbi:MAG TPA: AAA family ATPase [Anaeromyxobacteraceae bacterium]|nr:AAA family ATPase [Anaeromyxobacteraceae bacterium]